MKTSPDLRIHITCGSTQIGRTIGRTANKPMTCGYCVLCGFGTVFEVFGQTLYRRDTREAPKTGPYRARFPDR